MALDELNRDFGFKRTDSRSVAHASLFPVCCPRVVGKSDGKFKSAISFTSEPSLAPRISIVYLQTVAMYVSNCCVE